MTFRKCTYAVLIVAMALGPVAAAVSQEFSTSLSIDDECEPLTVVTVTDAWPGAEPLRYAFVSAGSAVGRAAAPSPALADAFDEVISVPLERVISLSSTAIPHIRDLGMADRLVGVDRGDHIYDEDIHRAVESGRIVEVGSGGTLNLERVVAARPDVVLTSAMGSDDPTLRRLKAAGIPVIVLADWREQSPLGRAEWIRFFGVLFDRTAQGDALFAERVTSYRRIAGVARDLPPDERPTIVANAPWQGTWPVPGGDSYVATLFHDAGGRYLWAETSGTGSRFLDLESVLQRAVHAEFWLHLNTGWESRADARNLDERLTLFQAYREGRMYHYSRRVRPWGANDFWESGAARPDLVLADLLHILHPRLLPEHELIFYRSLP